MNQMIVKAAPFFRSTLIFQMCVFADIVMVVKVSRRQNMETTAEYTDVSFLSTQH
jgi:hypothetical protein